MKAADVTDLVIVSAIILVVATGFVLVNLWVLRIFQKRKK
jgi:hypothetical protein